MESTAPLVTSFIALFLFIASFSFGLFMAAMTPMPKIMNLFLVMTHLVTSYIVKEHVGMVVGMKERRVGIDSLTSADSYRVPPPPPKAPFRWATHPYQQPNSGNGWWCLS